MSQMILMLAPVEATCIRAHVVASSSHGGTASVTDWLTGIGTVLAFFAGFGVLWVDLRERRRRQASAVAAWFERDENQATLNIVNSSDVPIYNARIIPKLLGVAYDVKRFPVLGPRAHIHDLTIPLPRADQVSN